MMQLALDMTQPFRPGLPVHSCDLCGSSGTPIDYDPRVHVCDGCGFCFVPERRSTERIAHAWDDVYEEGLYDPTWPGVKARLYYVAEWLDQHIGLKGKSVLDIGSGDGFFLDQCRQRGAHPVGLDPSPVNAAKIKARDIYCWTGWVDADKPTVGEYDIVTLNWCLENTGDLNGVLKVARDHLAKDGIVSVATGSRIMSGFRKPISSYFNLDIPADLHCFHFSPASLIKAFQRNEMLRAHSNDFDQNDVMIIAGQAVGHNFKVQDDDPRAVREFFTDWQRAWL